MMFCKKCGAQLGENVNVCNVCGTPVNDVVNNVNPVTSAEAPQVNNTINTVPNVDTPPVNNTVNATPASNNAFDKANIKKYALIGVAVIAVLIIVIKLFSGGSSSLGGSGALPKSKSSYEKICTGNQSYNDDATINMSFGLYMDQGKVTQDTVIEWVSTHGKIVVPDGSTETEIVSSFATVTGMAISFSGDYTMSSTNNYMKNGKVYITNTIVYNTASWQTTSALASDFEAAGLTCK